MDKTPPLFFHSKSWWWSSWEPLVTPLQNHSADSTSWHASIHKLVWYHLEVEMSDSTIRTLPSHLGTKSREASWPPECSQQFSQSFFFAKVIITRKAGLLEGRARFSWKTFSHSEANQWSKYILSMGFWRWDPESEWIKGWDLNPQPWRYEANMLITKLQMSSKTKQKSPNTYFY